MWPIAQAKNEKQVQNSNSCTVDNFLVTTTLELQVLIEELFKDMPLVSKLAIVMKLLLTAKCIEKTNEYKVKEAGNGQF